MSKEIIDMDKIEILTIRTDCVNKDCGFTVHLVLHDRGEWRECKGYLDPAKGFKEQKIFAIRIMEWKGQCEQCGREYEASFRIKLGE